MRNTLILRCGSAFHCTIKKGKQLYPHCSLMLMYRAKLILKQYLKLFSPLLKAVRPWEMLLLSAIGIRLGQAGSGL